MNINDIYEKICTLIKYSFENGLLKNLEEIFNVECEFENFQKDSLSEGEKEIYEKTGNLLGLLITNYSVSWKELIKSRPIELWKRVDMSKFGDFFNEIEKIINSKAISTSTVTALSPLVCLKNSFSESADENKEDTNETLENMKQCFDENSELSKSISEAFSCASFEKIGDKKHPLIDDFIEWTSLLKNPEEFKAFVNEKIMEYFYQYYLLESENRIEFHEFVKKSDSKNLTSYSLEKLNRLIQFETNFFHFGFWSNFQIFRGAFFDDFEISKEYIEILRSFYGNQKVDNWIIACIFQCFKDVKDSEFDNIFAGDNLIPISFIESYKEVLKKNELESPTCNLISKVEEVGLLAETSEEYKFFERDIFYFGLWEFFSYFPEKERTDYVQRFFEVFKGNCDVSSKIAIILNEYSTKIGIERKNPFSNIDFTDFEALTKAIYTFKNYSLNQKSFIINEMNLVDKKQKHSLNCLPDSVKFSSEEDAEKEWLEKEENRNKLKEIDCGFDISFRQYIPFFNEKVLYLDRKMKCKAFCEADKEFSYNINQTGNAAKNNLRYYIRYNENYRKSNKNNLTNIYLCLIRNIETHFSLHHSVDALLSDSYSKKHFFETVIDILNFLGEIDKTEKETNQKAAVEFLAKTFGIIFSEFALQIFDEKDVLGKPLISMFYEEKEDGTWQMKEDMIEKIDEMRFQKVKPFIKDAFSKVLNFLFGIESNFLDNFKFQITFYLIYLSFSL